MLAVLTSACNRDAVPAGQVVATVNGTEITIAELNNEARVRGLSIAADRRLRDALLTELVQRKILVEQAIRAGLDRSPQFLLDQRRSTDILLGQQLISTVAASQAPVSPTEVARFIGSHPAAFGRRALITVDRVRLDRLLNPAARRALSLARNTDAISSQLTALNIGGTRAVETWDSAMMSSDDAIPLLGKRSGDLFAVQPGGQLIVGQILSIRAAPTSAIETVRSAKEMIAQERKAAILADLAARKTVVTFQQKFAPSAAIAR